MAFEKITESESNYHDLERMTAHEILVNINKEDIKVPSLIASAIPQIEALVITIAKKMRAGGRMFYIGAGSSGRMGILDASECPPTFGMLPGQVIGLIAGGEKAMTQAVEFAEDDTEQGWLDLFKHNVNPADVVIGISASGSTAYTIHALEKCRENKIITGGISCNPDSPLSRVADHPIELLVGPEFLTGSTRMKAGSAQKMALNMISTSVMILLGRVSDNKMVNMQLINTKLVERGVKMVMDYLKLDDYQSAKTQLLKYGNVKKMLENYLP